ncbi:rhodanese-like domain-containing protein [Calothrix sp. UHCC 0171]|uniref:rhodanese-like domain-containing protein n=1 Tax=Calothrix sp. UHCC 0171 TaxID=3110245 RepID=UPI002B1EEE1A|nr:rhodanese-like domain-containing protein [Calothrix sp. UHCC 0171]MEA5574355.1 rhodanese-like domain-containing protein [Calothrix sp. UHCC 0171]
MTTELSLIEPSELKLLLAEAKVTLIDVREVVEYASENIPSGINIPLSNFSYEKLPETSQPIVLYCQTGRRSQQAAQKLLATGFNIQQLRGGMNAWKEAGYKTKINQNAPISLMRQVQIVAGSLVFLGTILGVLVSPLFLIMSGFVGAGLVFAGVTNTCALGMLLAKLPYNQRA